MRLIKMRLKEPHRYQLTILVNGKSPPLLTATIHDECPSDMKLTSL